VIATPTGAALELAPAARRLKAGKQHAALEKPVCLEAGGRLLELQRLGHQRRTESWRSTFEYRAVPLFQQLEALLQSRGPSAIPGVVTMDWADGDSRADLPTLELVFNQRQRKVAACWGPSAPTPSTYLQWFGWVRALALSSYRSGHGDSRAPRGPNGKAAAEAGWMRRSAASALEPGRGARATGSPPARPFPR